MKSLFAVALALTAITAAVEAKGQTKKRGLEESLLYAQQNQLSLGSPIDLGSIHGFELQSLEALGSGLTSGVSGYGITSLGNQGLNLVSAGLQDYSLSLGNIGHYSVDSAALLGGGGLYGSGLTLSNGYASGYGLGNGIALSSPQVRPPVSIPRIVAPVPAVPQQSRLGPPLTREESAAASPSRIFGATRPGTVPPAPPLIPPTAFPPTNVPLPIAARPPAPLRVPGPVIPSGVVQLRLPQQQASALSAQLPTPAPLPAPLPSTQPAQAPPGGRLGSGSLGYTDLGNGVIAFGSGSLGYTPSQAVNNQQPQQQVQFGQQQGQPQIPQPSLPPALPSGFSQSVQIGQQQGLTYGSVQNLPLTQAYGGIQQSLAFPQQQQLLQQQQLQQQQLQQQQQSPVYTSVPNTAFNLQYAGLQQGIYGTQQLSFSGQQGSSDVGYGGYSLSGNRAGTLEHVNLNSGLNGLNLNYGGDSNLLASLANGY